MNDNEKQFADFLTKNKLQFIFHPRIEVLSSINYTPDFFVLQNNTYYEVIGTRQAYHQNKIKINLAEVLVNLKIVKPNGTLFTFGKSKNIESAVSVVKISQLGKRKFNWDAFLFDNLMTPQILAEKAQLSYPTLRLMVMGKYIAVKYARLFTEIGLDIQKYYL